MTNKTGTWLTLSLSIAVGAIAGFVYIAMPLSIEDVAKCSDADMKVNFIFQEYEGDLIFDYCQPKRFGFAPDIGIYSKVKGNAYRSAVCKMFDEMEISKVLVYDKKREALIKTTAAGYTVTSYKKRNPLEVYSQNDCS